MVNRFCGTKTPRNKSEERGFSEISNVEEAVFDCKRHTSLKNAAGNLATSKRSFLAAFQAKTSLRTRFLTFWKSRKRQHGMALLKSRNVEEAVWAAFRGETSLRNAVWLSENPERRRGLFVCKCGETSLQRRRSRFLAAFRSETSLKNVVWNSEISERYKAGATAKQA